MANDSATLELLQLQQQQQMQQWVQSQMLLLSSMQAAGHIAGQVDPSIAVAAGYDVAGGGSQASEGKRYVARIKSYVPHKGFGFVTSEELKRDFGMDVFIHKQEMDKMLSAAGKVMVPTNALVSFSVMTNRQGQPQVRNMQIERDVEAEEAALRLQRVQENPLMQQVKLSAQLQAEVQAQGIQNKLAPNAQAILTEVLSRSEKELHRYTELVAQLELQHAAAAGVAGANNMALIEAKAQLAELKYSHQALLNKQLQVNRAAEVAGATKTAQNESARQIQSLMQQQLEAAGGDPMAALAMAMQTKISDRERSRSPKRT